ncbi:MAG: T9SS type A sorting domain-containing protein [Candidatus Cloacimonetes bacterium]|nr:T9SS type A sorting domain-containing protein [Candidatus Cloacimonadota bacterium]
MTLINWDVIPGTEFVMIVYATATLDGKFVCADSSNQLAAFGPDSTKCRGIAVWEEGNHPQWCTDYHYWDLEGYWYITVVDTIEYGQTITFKLYETKTDSIYQCYETVIFDSCTFDTSIDLTAPSPEMDQVFGLIEDWNWISFNVQPDDYSIDSVFAPLTVTPDIYQVKSQSQSATYYPGVGFQGDLTHITNGEGYLVNMINAVDPFTVSGTAINPIINPIDLLPNWNWVGYYPYVTLTLDEALESIITGDTIVVKTQLKSAILIGANWIGDLLQMEPGVHYKIHVKDTTTLTYPEPVCYKLLPLTTDDYSNSAGWKVMPGTQYNMIAMADIMINDVVIDNNNEYIVGVFDEEGNCRSIGYWVSELWYFTIVGNKDDEDLDFRIYDSKNDIVYESNEKITFTSDSIIGNPEKPIIVTFKGTPADISLTFDLNQNYPNPFGSTTGISYTLPKSGHVHLTVYNVKGQLVETLVNNYQEADNYTIKWDASKLSSGIYFYKLTCHENSIIKRCLIMK